MISISAKNLINFDFENFYSIFRMTSSFVSAVVVNELTSSLLSDIFISLNYDDDFIFINKPYLSTLTGLHTLSVPDTITDIQTECFSKCSNISAVMLPSSVSSIGDYAFEQCKNLQYINTENIKHIGQYAFENCHMLSSCNFSAANIVIEEHAFDDCYSLKNIVLNNQLSINFPNFCGSQRKNLKNYLSDF